MDVTDDLSALPDAQIEEILRALGVTAATEALAWSEIRLSRALRQEVASIAARMAAGETVTMAELGQRMAAVAASLGHDMGVPMPDLDFGHQFITAARTPIGAALQANTGGRDTASVTVLNGWTKLGDEQILLIEQGGRRRVARVPLAGARLRQWIDTCSLRTRVPNLTAEAEWAAMALLKTKVTEVQWGSYLLNGCFLERSRRSDLLYIFRKGFPTLVCSHHGAYAREGRILAALCLHPFGYYDGTFCGSMTPTDEVLSHLLLMRADEHRFWAKSGQWAAHDLRSGL